MTVVPGIVRTRFREHVLSGEPPQKVSDLQWTISPDHLAHSIAGGLQKRKRFIVNPRIGSLFSALDFFFPRIMDWYCSTKWDGAAHTASAGAARRMAG